MPGVLISILAAVLSGGSIGTVLGALSLTQWLTLGAGVLSLEPDFAKLLGLQHPALGTLVDNIGKGAAVEVASKEAKNWFAANADKAIELQPGIKGI
jgi:hypothetical protein